MNGVDPKDPAGVGNVDKIRDILFGNQMRDYESRFVRLEETLLKESADMRESTRKRLDSLEGYLKKELEALKERLKTERDERTASGKQHARDLNGANESLEKRIRELDERFTQHSSELRGEVLDQSKELFAEIGARHSEVGALLEKRFAQLRHEKTDRAALAAMLTELAMRLNDEFRMPAAAE